MNEKPLIPNFTQVPNVLFDKIMPLLNGNEFVCLMYIARRTYGFKKDEDRISYSQFESGVEGKDTGTGLARSTINRCIDSLIQCGLVIKTETSLGNIYKINVDITNLDEVVSKRNQYRNETSLKGATGIVTKPKLVSKRNRQNKGNKEVLNTAPDEPAQQNTKANDIPLKEAGPGSYLKQNTPADFLSHQEISTLIDAFKPVNPSYTRFYSNKTQRRALYELVRAITYDKLLTTINALPSLINKPYCPKITSPCDLQRDLGKLIAFYNQQKGLTTNKTKIII